MVRRVIAAVARRWRVRRALAGARVESRSRVQRVHPSSVLVLCYGNIYRSPLAAQCLRQQLEGAGITVTSAGFHPVDGRSCDPSYVDLCKELGFDLSAHRSAHVSREQTRTADLIVLMDRHNHEALRELDPGALDKVIWLGSFRQARSVEIEDPYGGPSDLARRTCLSVIEASTVLANSLDASIAHSLGKPLA